MELSDIFIYALREIDGFDEDAVKIAVDLAKNDFVETDEEFIDFINFNIEDGKFPQIKAAYSPSVIRKAILNARKNESKIVHHVAVGDEEYPRKLLSAQIGPLSTLSYRGNLKILERKTIMITGSCSVTDIAKPVSVYLGKVFARRGYNILTSFTKGCEEAAFKGCLGAAGICTGFTPYSLDSSKIKNNRHINKWIEEGRLMVISLANWSRSEKIPRHEIYRYLSELADCLIIPQISSENGVMFLVQRFLAHNKPVFLIKYTAGDGTEYDCLKSLEMKGAKYLSLQQIIDSISENSPIIYKTNQE